MWHFLSSPLSWERKQALGEVIWQGSCWMGPALSHSQVCAPSSVCCLGWRAGTVSMGQRNPGARLHGTWGLAEAPALAESRPWASRVASLVLPVRPRCQVPRREVLKRPLLAELGVRLSVPGGGGALSPWGDRVSWRSRWTQESSGPGKSLPAATGALGKGSRCSPGVGPSIGWVGESTKLRREDAVLELLNCKYIYIYYFGE